MFQKYKKYINKKYLIAASLAALALASLAALVGYEKACQEHERAQEQALQAKLQARQAQKKAEKLAVKKLIKVDVQQPFAQRFPAHRHSKRVYNQVTPKKRVVRYDSFDNLESFALGAQAKPESKKIKSEPAAASRAASSYSSPSSSAGNSTSSYNSSSYSAPSSSMVSTPSWSGTPAASRSNSSQAGSPATPRAHAPAASAHEHVSHDAGSRTGGQSRPAQTSVAEPEKKEAPSKPVAKKEEKQEEKKEKKPEREFNPSPAKVKPERKQKREQVGGVGPTEPTLEDILKNYGSQVNAPSEELDELDPNAQDPLTQPSFSDKFKAGVQSLVELLVTVSMVKNGWDYVKQACDWLESTFGIGKWVRSLVGSGPQAVPQVEPALQDQVAPPAEAQSTEQSVDSSAPAPGLEEQVGQESRDSQVATEPAVILESRQAN